ncbi:MAG: hypothetical protein CR968_00350 [Flavobacteriia bacterium]|nr:MAG: hypothetical protein CR968_00350 [Flavobacteriia bacterium]
MTTKRNFKTLLFILVILVIKPLQAQEDESSKGINIGNIIEMSGNWFIAYRNGIEQSHPDETTPVVQSTENQFMLKRSYFTLKKDLNDVLSVRYTQDLTIDTEGSDAGNVETRLKYLYLKIKPELRSKTFTGTYMEIGMVHTPWVDFEQKINSYRVHDNMFIERNKLTSSADFGVLVAGNIGPVMDKEYLKTVNGAMKGKYMSYAFGVFNGAGYSGREANHNKVVEGRLSFRPFPNKVPELQFSTSFMLGKGNSEFSPEFTQYLGFLAYVGKQLTLVAQGHTGTGDFRARYVEDDHPEIALDNQGYSFFGEYKIKNSPFAVWGRYDDFKVLEKINFNTKRYIAGVAYTINDYLRVVGAYERNETFEEDNDIYEINFEVSF